MSDALSLTSLVATIVIAIAAHVLPLPSPKLVLDIVSEATIASRNAGPSSAIPIKIVWDSPVPPALSRANLDRLTISVIRVANEGDAVLDFDEARIGDLSFDLTAGRVLTAGFLRGPEARLAVSESRRGFRFRAAFINPGEDFVIYIFHDGGEGDISCSQRIPGAEVVGLGPVAAARGLPVDRESMLAAVSTVCLMVSSGLSVLWVVVLRRIGGRAWRLAIAQALLRVYPATLATIIAMLIVGEMGLLTQPVLLGASAIAATVLSVVAPAIFGSRLAGP